VADLLRRLDAIARVAAAIAGTLPPSLLATNALALYLPASPSIRFAIAYFAFVPLWITAMTCTFLVRRGWLACAICAAATVVLQSFCAR
jgi:hypothetical protein